MTESIQLRGGKFWIKAKIRETPEKFHLLFNYNPELLDEIRSMEGAKWNPETRSWSFNNSGRNRFQLQYLRRDGSNPYEAYEKPLIEWEPSRKECYKHQIHMTRHVLTYRQVILAAEMGCIAGDAEILINLGGATQRHTLTDLYRRWQGGWYHRDDIKIKSYCGEYLQLNRLLGVLDKGFKPTVKLILKSGKTLTLTPDHEVATPSGFSAVESLQIGDCVLTYGRWLDKDGYIRVGGLKGIHPRWTTGGVYEHILVMEQMIGRYIEDTEIVHHKNEIRYDNRPDNLELLESSSEHRHANYSNFGRSNPLPVLDYVADIQQGGIQNVFDLVCQDPHRNFVANGIIVHNCGKTLTMIEAIETINFEDVLWVGPKSALEAVSLEFKKWKARILPIFITYDRLKTVVENWPSGQKAPRVVVGDESARCKSPTAQRSIAMQHLCEAVRRDHGQDGYIVLMSGAPAPKSPLDWWKQCLAADTWILTSEGPRQISSLQGRSFGTYFGSQVHSCPEGSFKSGHKQVFEIRTKEGYKLKLTGEHELLVNYFGLNLWQQTQNIKVGDKICLHNHHDSEWQGNGTFEDGYLLGHLIGDGTVNPRGYGSLSFWPDDYCVIPYVLSLVEKGKQLLPNQQDKITIYSQRVHDLCREYGLDESKEINSLIEGASSNFLCGLVSALCDTDANVETGRLRIALGQSDLKRLEAIQRILLYLGILSRIGLKKEAGVQILEGKDAYVLTIAGEHAREFYARIGFKHTIKNEMLRLQLGIKSQMSQRFEAEVAAIVDCGNQDVWDLSVPAIKAMSANGFVAHNCEIVQPGFLREGTYEKFRRRLGMIVSKESLTGGTYPHLVTWYDDGNKCAKCGMLEKHANHDLNEALFAETTTAFHKWEPSINEIDKLYRRMKGLTLVYFKKDCLAELPEKRYRTIECKPSQEVLNAAKIITGGASSTIVALSLLRELSDGFQYAKEDIGMQPCPRCSGTGIFAEPTFTGVGFEESPEAVAVWESDTPEDEKQRRLMEMGCGFEAVEGPCVQCNGVGQVAITARKTLQVKCPKEDALVDIFDTHEDDGRLIVYAGFTGSIDRIVGIANRLKWNWIKVDGRGWNSSWGVRRPRQMLEAFQDDSRLLDKIVFIGHPGSAGVGLNLTKSSEIVYYSNDFNADSRIQSEDRIHRPGMDLNKGALITDLVHLPTDEKVLQNLKAKRRLQDISLGQFQEALRIALTVERVV